METIKQINIKNRTYYFYNDIIDRDGYLLRVFTKGFYYGFLIITCSKLAVLNKAFWGAFLSLKRHIFI